MNACLGQSYLTETVQLDRGYKTLFKQRSDWTLSEYSIGAISKYMFYVLFIISGVQGSGLEGGLARGLEGLAEILERALRPQEQFVECFQIQILKFGNHF